MLTLARLRSYFVVVPILLLLAASPVLGATVIVDNSDAGFSTYGTWTLATDAQQYGANYRYRNSVYTIPGYYAQWRPSLPEAGSYQVSIWYPAAANRPTNVPCTVYYDGGSQPSTINQTINGGQWHVLGTFNFPAGSGPNAAVRVWGNPVDQNGKPVAADAVRFSAIHALTMATAPNGAGTTSPTAGTTVLVAESNPVTVTAAAASGYVFSHWEVSAGAPAADPYAATSSLTVDVAKTVTAVFLPAGFVDLTMAVSPPGAGTTSPSAGGTYLQDELIDLTATANAGYVFHHWSVSAGVSVAAPYSPDTTVVMDQPKIITAVFVQEGATVKSLGDLTGPWQLLVDDYGVAQKTDVVRTYHAFSKYAGNPVLTSTRVWEGPMVYVYGTVLPNETGPGYRMWYHTLPTDGDKYRILYATSPDGISWDKPDLGIVDYNGSTANNIFIRRTGKDHIPSIMHTPWEADPLRRYKMINYDNDYGFVGAYSGDGIHWTDAPPRPIVTSGDVGNFVWDTLNPRCLGYIKVGAYVDGMKRRAVGFSATSRFESWQSPYLILAPDTFDDRWATGIQRTHFYGMCGFAYESMYLGFLWVFRATDSEGYYDGTIFIELVTSHDGVHWSREEGDRPPILPLGPTDSWDDGMLFTTQHPLVEGDTVKLFYGGCDVTHASPTPGHGGVGLATLRKDGFASLDAGATTGLITTKKLIGAAGALHVNYSAPSGSLRVEVLDEDSNVLPGYGATDCTALQGDSVDQAVTWTANTELPTGSAPIRLRFVMENASLYSYMAGDAAKVIEEATITQQPQPQNICPAGNARFTVAAVSDSAMSYRWQKDGADLADGGHYFGTATNRLLVLDADSGDSGGYRCVITNLAGATTSDAATLSFTPTSFTGVGLLPGASSSTVTGITGDGAIICGTSASQAFIWTAADGIKALGAPSIWAPTSYAAGVGIYQGTVVVAVNTDTTTYKAKKWIRDAAGVETYYDLPLMDGTQEWTVRGLGTNGTSELWIAGSAISGGDGASPGGREAGCYQLTANATPSYPLPTNGHDNSDFHVVSDTGYLAGQFQYGGNAPSGGARNAMRSQGTTSLSMCTLYGDPSTSHEAVAKAISRDGFVQGGWSAGPASGTTAVIWRDSATITEIPFLAGEGAAETKALNGDGTIAAGYSRPASGSTRRAWIWDAVNGTREVATLLQSRGLDLTGWQLNEVTAMSGTTNANYTGLVLAGIGTHNGITEGWVAVLGYTPTSAPTIAAQPQSQTSCPDATVTFTVSVAGQESPIYQWLKDGASLTDDGHYSGARTTMLIISDIDAGDAAQYSCMVAGSCGSVISDAAALTIQAETEVTHDPAPQTVAPGGTAQFTVTADGEGELSYQWQKGGADLSDGGHYTGVATATLTVSNADEEDVAEYRCRVSATCGSETSDSATLTLAAPICPADFDDDGDVDLTDFGAFRSCFNGPNRPPANANCARSDFDGDSDVDLTDFGQFRSCFNGPNRPPACP